MKCFRPEVIILNAGGNGFQLGVRAIMNDEDVVKVAAAAPNAKLFVTHLEGVNHNSVTREMVRKRAEAAGILNRVFIPEEATFGRTRKLLEEFKDSDAEILICTKSDLVLRDLDLLKQMKKVTVSWSINTLDETFRADMDKAVSIERRIAAMRRSTRRASEQFVLCRLSSPASPISKLFFRK